MKPVQKYATLFSLYIAQAVPMSFFSTVLPVILRTEKISFSAIALIQLIKLPWILKFLWAPLVDYKAGSHLHYKRWIIGSEIFYAATIIAIAFFNLKVNFPVIVVLMVIAIAFSATQDIASDALAIRILKSGEQPLGNSMQSMGSFAGTLIGSGVLLMVYAITGWSFLMVALATFVLVALLPLALFVKKKEAPDPVTENPRIKMTDIFTFFAIPGVGKWIFILALYYSGFLGILSLLKPWMVDLHFSIKEIAFMVGIFGTGCGAAGALLGGFILKKVGNYRGLLLFAAYGFLAVISFVVISHLNPGKYYLYLAIALLWSAYAMASVAVYTISMTKVRPGKEGTDYSVQIVVTHLMGILVSIGAGKLADTFGVPNFFLLEACVSLIVLMLVYLLFKKELEVK